MSTPSRDMADYLQRDRECPPPTVRSPGKSPEVRSRAFRLHRVCKSQGCSGAGMRGADGVPPLFLSGGRVPHPSPLFWTEIRAKVSPLLQLVTY